jgi:hypothetical protein
MFAALSSLPRSAARAAVLAAILLTQASAAPQTPANCIGEWVPTFGGLSGVQSSVHASVAIQAQVVFDDGSAPALYVAGDFATAGGHAAPHIARWNGTSWSALGSGTNGTVLTLTVFDDGTGPALFAGGTFTNAGGVAANHIAKWNGTSWSALGAGCDAEVQAQVVFDDGSGPALHVSGHFSNAGGVVAFGAARWNGTSWSALGNLGPASDLAVFDDGMGAALFAVVGSAVAKWDGLAWTLVGALQPFDAWGQELHVFDDGGGVALYVAGAFTGVEALPASGLARWNGTAWSVPGSPPSGPEYVYTALTDFYDGTGPALYAAWTRPILGGQESSISRWNGSNWSLVNASDPANLVA